jgi:peptidoglycan/LPS O-acetylase OafA/YrhL
MVDADTGTSSGTGQRIAALALLLVAGVLSLPVAAAFLDGEGTENFIIPAQLVGMAAIGAVVGALLPGLARAGSSSGRAARIGAAIGVGMAILGVVVFFLLLNGFDGA